MTTEASPNPANAPDNVAQQPGLRRRVPMSVPRRKLEVTDVPGFHLHWFIESNVRRALQAGYEFVDDKEVVVNQSGVGNSLELTGNQDLGSRVTVVGGVGADGKEERLVLMKIKEEWFREDQKLIEERNASVLSQIFRGETIFGAENDNQSDRSLRYVDEHRTSFERSPKALFQRPTRKAR